MIYAAKGLIGLVGVIFVGASGIAFERGEEGLGRGMALTGGAILALAIYL